MDSFLVRSLKKEVENSIERNELQMIKMALEIFNPISCRLFVPVHAAETLEQVG